MHEHERGRQAGQSAENRDDHRFDQDLDEDVQCCGPYGFTNADLANPLRDTRQHDIHDADTPDEKADTRNQAAAQAGVAHEVVDLFRPFFLSPETEILNAFVSTHEHVPDLLQRLGQ